MRISWIHRALEDTKNDECSPLITSNTTTSMFDQRRKHPEISFIEGTAKSFRTKICHLKTNCDMYVHK